ncbi:MAG TPA: hypothetical protein VL977_03730 [Solirubrobacteraceae bacterium]|nr:hypothetical protein [Solirubrobacteraceae bacterium]
MSEPNAHSSEATLLGELAREVLIDLYAALSGRSPTAVRVYGEADALLLLMRFDPAELSGLREMPFEPLIDTTFIALPSMIASAVENRTGRTLYPGNLSVCAERGLAVFAFSALGEERDDRARDDLFASLAPASRALAPS